MAFHWATKERFDRRVHRLVFKMSETSTCTYSVAHSGRTIDSGYQYFDLLQHGNKTDFSTSAQRLSGESFVRTDAFTRTAGAGSNREYSNVNVSRDLPSAGVTTLTLISRNQQPTASSVIPGYSLAVSIRCDRPFEVLNGQVGSEASMLALEELSGRSAGTVIGATAAALMHTVDTFALNSGIYLSLAAENQIGTLRIKHPAGVVDSILELDADFYDLPSGAGRYQIELTRSAAPIDDFMLATYGLEQTLDLQADRLAQSAIKAD